MSRSTGVVFSACVLFCMAATAYGAAINHGTIGVADTTKVSSVLQLTTNETSYDNYIAGDNYPMEISGIGAIEPWSQDGQWVVFTSEHGQTYEENREIAKIKIDGSSYTRLTNNSVEDSTASFSSDGKIYSQQEIGSSYVFFLTRMNSDGNGVANLSAAHSAATSELWPIVSPDGTKVAYIQDDPVYDYLLYVANADGSSPELVSKDAIGDPIELYYGDGGGFSWGPDSQWLVYTGYAVTESNKKRIFKVNADGTSPSQLTTDTVTSPLPDHLLPVISPDGNTIAYWWRQYNSRWYYELRIISATGGAAIGTIDSANQSVTNGWNALYAPFTWSPDSQWITYSKQHHDGSYTDSNAIFIAKADGSGSPAQLTTGYWDYMPYWSPAGDAILFQARPGNGTYASRRTSCTTDCQGQIMLLNLTDNYGGNGTVSSLFPWCMFLPAIQANSR